MRGNFACVGAGRLMKFLRIRIKNKRFKLARFGTLAALLTESVTRSVVMHGAGFGVLVC